MTEKLQLGKYEHYKGKQYMNENNTTPRGL